MTLDKQLRKTNLDKSTPDLLFKYLQCFEPRPLTSIGLFTQLGNKTNLISLFTEPKTKGKENLLPLLPSFNSTYRMEPGLLTKPSSD